MRNTEYRIRSELLLSAASRILFYILCMDSLMTTFMLQVVSVSGRRLESDVQIYSGFSAAALLVPTVRQTTVNIRNTGSLGVTVRGDTGSLVTTHAGR